MTLIKVTSNQEVLHHPRDRESSMILKLTLRPLFFHCYFTVGSYLGARKKPKATTALLSNSSKKAK